MSTRLLGRPTGASPSVSAWHSSFPRAWSPNEARWEPPRGVIPELLLDRTALRGRQPLASEFDKTLIARGPRPRSQPLGANATAEKLPPARHSDLPLALVSHVCRVSTLPTADQFSLRKPSSASLNAGAVRTGAACRAPGTTMSRDPGMQRLVVSAMIL